VQFSTTSENSISNLSGDEDTTPKNNTVRQQGAHTGGSGGGDNGAYPG